MGESKHTVFPSILIIVQFDRQHERPGRQLLAYWRAEMHQLIHTNVPSRVIGADSTERILWAYRLIIVTPGLQLNEKHQALLAYKY